MNVTTIVLIPGLWMTALCWENWVKHYTDKGYRVIAANWPGMEGDIEQLRRHPSDFARLGLTEVVDHYEQIIRELETPPVIIGYGFGGLITQILLDRGWGAAGVAIATAPVKGIFCLPLSTLKVSLAALRNPFNTRGTTSLSPKQFRYAFTNALTEAESLAAYERYVVPGPNRILLQAALANLDAHAASAVNVGNDTRAPLLLVAGSKDRFAPPSLVKANFELYRQSKAETDYKEFPDGTHFMVGQEGWDKIADYVLCWALCSANPESKLSATLNGGASWSLQFSSAL
jgi:pimeloyl-ACP methyl ester carboxylesterase